MKVTEKNGLVDMIISPSICYRTSPTESRLAKVLHFPKPEQLISCFPETRQESEFVLKTVPIGVISRVGACVARTHLARRTFRRVVSRTPVFKDADGESKLAYFIDTMECGHQKTAYLGFYWDENSHLVDVVPKAKRHFCQTCQELNNKKPAQPAPLSAGRKVA